MPSETRCYVLLSEAARYNDNGSGAYRPRANLFGLAQALAASPPWPEIPGAVLVYRPEPKPVLAILGDFDDAAKVRVGALRRLLHRVEQASRYISYEQAEQDCERLARALIERFGRDEIRRCNFVAIPRGGMIVLGMLAYLLKLQHSQLETFPASEAPLVVVDDCSLTGSRFARFIAQYQDRELIFAPLYSHPELRTSIEEGEARVLGCVSAQDLHDYAPEQLGSEYQAWRDAWLQRFGGPRYWMGRPEKLIFSWSEPDHALWNSVTGRLEASWRIAAPEDCLKNRSAAASGCRLQVQREGKGPLRPSIGVVFGEFKDRVIVAHTATSATFSLAGVAADMWRTIVRAGNAQAAARVLMRDYDVDGNTLLADLHEFAGDLVARGLLERQDALA